jgi:hypothetical protein
MKSDILSTAIKKKLVLSGISYAVSIYIIILLFGYNESTFLNSQYKESFSCISGYIETYVWHCWSGAWCVTGNDNENFQNIFNFFNV